MKCLSSGIHWITPADSNALISSQIDKPVSPSNRGMLYFTQGVTDEMRQANRDRLFNVTRDDVIHVARTWVSQVSYRLSEMFYVLSCW